MLRTIALIAALLVPFGLLHVWVLAEAAIAVTDLLFLAHSFQTKSLAWARQPWFIAAAIWWAWVVLCSIPVLEPTAGWVMGFVEALVIIRLIVFAAALQTWLLTTSTARTLAWAMLAASTLWIGAESWQQFLTGHNIFGDPRWGDGSLTGPFWKPRAGDLYGHLLFIALLPPVMALLARPQKAARAAGVALAILGVVTSVLIGQRMGNLFTILGLLTAAALLKPLRLPAAIVIAAAAIVLIATPLISPPTHAKLVGETATNMHHFAQSPYGELYTRATVMGLQSPLHGWGYNGFRTLCPLPRFTQGLPALNIPPTQLGLAACNLHPHNFYLQAFADSGYPGLVLFTIMMLTLLATTARGLWRAQNPLRTGLFAAFVTFAWPLASTDEFPTLYMSGWLFFALGLALALTHINPNPIAPDPANA